MDPTNKNRIIDISSAVGLAIAVSLVFIISGTDDQDDTGGEPGSNGDPATPVVIEVGEPVEVQPTTTPKILKLGVMPGEFDDIGKLLETLGKGYSFDILNLRDLESPKKLAEYDVIFVACGSYPRIWLGNPTGAATTRNATIYAWDESYAKLLGESIDEYTKQGGIIYASDWIRNLIILSFPEMTMRTNLEAGKAQHATATVVDKGLAANIGNTIELNFDLKGWKPATFEGKNVKEYLRGDVELITGTIVSLPLLVEITNGKGSVLFTSFHNETQNSEKEMLLLKYLVFASVTAEENARARDVLVQGGFSPSASDIFTSSDSQSSTVYEYPNPEKANLSFVLGFANQGAKLTMEIVDPQGKVVSAKTGSETFQISVNGAVAGDWVCRIKAEIVPFENFPYTLNVGSKSVQ
jgi:hypothetical protein